LARSLDNHGSQYCRSSRIRWRAPWAKPVMQRVALARRNQTPSRLPLREYANDTLVMLTCMAAGDRAPTPASPSRKDPRASHRSRLPSGSLTTGARQTRLTLTRSANGATSGTLRQPWRSGRGVLAEPHPRTRCEESAKDWNAERAVGAVARRHAHSQAMKIMEISRGRSHHGEDSFGQQMGQRSQVSAR